MSLTSLLLCSDAKIVRVLRRTLGDLEIGVEHCGEADSALRMLSRNRFEAIIVDCADPRSAEVLRSARRAHCNKRAVAVAIVDGSSGLRSIFDLGAHFVLYKPVSSERAKSSFRAARALMKRERRRNVRVTVQIPVTIMNSDQGGQVKVTTTDLSEGGMAIGIPRGKQPRGSRKVMFTLPGADAPLELMAEFAWEGTSSQAGLRFVDVSPETAHQLRDWLKRNSPDAEQDDPPVPCKLTDLSLGGCYLEISSPFPVNARVTLSMRAGSVQMRTEGVVRVMHPDKGMGVEFAQTTRQHRETLEKFLAALTENRDLMPELLVEPEALDSGSKPDVRKSTAAGEAKDPLLELFDTHGAVAADFFSEELRKQRGLAASAASA